MKKNILITIFLILLFYQSSAEKNEEKMRMELQVKSPITSDIVFSKNGEKIAAVNNNNILVWNKNGRLEKYIQNKDWVKSIDFSSNNRFLVCTIDNYIKIFDLVTGKETAIVPVIEWRYGIFYSAAITPDNNHIITGVQYTKRFAFPIKFSISDFKNNILNKASKQEQEILKKNYIMNKTGNECILDEYMIHDDYIILHKFFDKIKLSFDTIREVDNRLELWTIDGKFIKKLGVFDDDENSFITRLVISPEKDKFLAYSRFSGIIIIYDLNGNKLITIKAVPQLFDIKFNSNGKLFGWLSPAYSMQICSLDGIFFKNIPKNVFDFNIDKEIYIELGYSFNSSETLFNVIMKDFKNNIILQSQYFQTSFMISKISPDFNYVAAASLDGSLKIINVKTGEFVSLINEENDWLSYTEDGYWDCSLNGGKMMAMIQGYEAFSIDQFAAKYNRPDIILKRIGIEDNDLLNYYYKEYQKRLFKMGLNQKEIETNNILHAPQVKLSGDIQNDKFVKLIFTLKDSKYDLKSYNIFVNDVPIFEAYGKKISGREQILSETVELISGKNKIEVSCTNEKGTESIRAVTLKNYNKEIKGDLYFIGFGISDYNNDNINDLEYAHKDVLDLKELVTGFKNHYKNIYAYTFINNDVTIKNIIDAKLLLKKSKVDDTFILFIAGHGVHDKDDNSTFYYITYNSDLKNLSKSAANFELIEDLLQAIPPRNKLFLMDTCGSGEYSDEKFTMYLDNNGVRSIKERSMKPVSRTGKAVQYETRYYLYEKDRFIYNDLKRRSGAIVFSSSKADEYSYEAAKIENGLFTEEIINAFKTKNADENNDNNLSIDELKKYVTEAVIKLSNNLQHPTVDRDNIYQKFSFPVIN